MDRKPLYCGTPSSSQMRTLLFGYVPHFGYTVEDYYNGYSWAKEAKAKEGFRISGRRKAAHAVASWLG
jgi:hypothetical protein